MTVSAQRVFQPKAVPGGQRVMRGAPKKKHKDRPKVGRGQYVKAPLFRDKVTKPRWAANALLNNPGNALASAGIGGGAVLLVDDRKVKKSDDRKRNALGGALVGGGAAHIGRQQAGYGAKYLSERAMRNLSEKGNYGPYKPGKYRDTLHAHAKESQRATKGQGIRAKAAYFNDNYPKGVPGYGSRKALKLISNPKTAVGVVGGGAVVGGVAGSRKRVSKSRTIPARRLNEVGGKFGSVPKNTKDARDIKISLPGSMGYLGWVGGLAGGAAAAGAVHRKELKAGAATRDAQARQMRSNTAKIKRAKLEVSKARKPGKKLKPYTGPKGPTYKITDMGTKAHKYNFANDSTAPRVLRLGTGLSTGSKVAAGVGAGVGIPLGVKAVNDQRKQFKTTIARQEARLKRQEEELKSFGKSAFGVDHG